LIDMKVTILGNNGPFPAAGGACSSYLIEADGKKVLADAGSGSLSNLMKCMDPAELDAIILTHLHWDHITDIPVLFYYLHVSRLQGREIPVIPLYLPASPVGVFEIISGFNAFDINILNEESIINIDKLKVTTASMTHPVESYALKFTANGKSLVYSGDTTYNSKLPVFAAGCDLLITASAFLDEELTSASPHMSAAQCARVASDAGVIRLLLSHLNPNTDADEYLQEASAFFTKTTVSELMKEYEV